MEPCTVESQPEIPDPADDALIDPQQMRAAVRHIRRELNDTLDEIDASLAPAAAAVLKGL